MSHDEALIRRVWAERKYDPTPERPHIRLPIRRRMADFRPNFDPPRLVSIDECSVPYHLRWVGYDGDAKQELWEVWSGDVLVEKIRTRRRFARGRR